MKLDRWVDRAVEVLDEATREQFAQDPLSALTDRLGLTVRAVDTLSSSRADGGFCDGMSFLDDGVVLYAPTPNSRRQNFTLAHELGHWIVDRDTRLFDYIADQSDPAVLLESVCDQIAQRLLLPGALIETVVGAGPVRAHHVHDLFEQSQASRQACAIGISRRIAGLGAVVLIDRSGGLVDHASVRPDPDEGWPEVFPWRGQLLEDSHPLRTAAAGTTLTRRMLWRDSWGRQAEFYVDASIGERQIIAVLAAADVWQLDSMQVLQPREFDKRPTLSVYCCGQERTFRGYPCTSCHEGFCPSCKRCRCERRAASELNCIVCNSLVQAHLLQEGACELCR